MDQIQGFFNIPVENIHSSSLFIPYIKTLHSTNLVFVSPNLQNLTRVKSYAEFFHVPFFMSNENNFYQKSVYRSSTFYGIEGKDAIIISNAIYTGKSITQTANSLMEYGVSTVSACCTHPLLVGDSYSLIEESPITELIVFDTIPLRKESDKIKVITTADLFAEVIRRIKINESISSLNKF